MTHFRRIAWVLLVWLLAAQLAQVARAQHDAAPPADYQPTIDQAVSEFDASHWAEARALFEQAHQLFPNARTLRGLGMTSFELRDYPAAIRYLNQALTETRRALTSEQHTQVSALLTRAQAFVGHFTLPIAPSGARAFVDGERVEPEGDWPMNPGTLVLGVGNHTIAIHAEDGRSVTASLIVRGRENAPLEIDLAPLSTAPTESPSELDATRDQGSEIAGPLPAVTTPASDDTHHGVPAGPLIVATSGGVVAVVGIVLFVLGRVDVNKVQHAARGTEWQDVSGAYDGAPVLTGVGGALAIVGAAAAVGGIVWALGSSRSDVTDVHHDSGDPLPSASLEWRARIGLASASVEARW